MEEDENKLNESFISRWSKRKSGIVSDEDNLELNKKLRIDEDKKNKKSSEKEIDESNYDELNDEELLEKFKLPNPDKIKKEKGLDVFFKDGVPDRLRQIALRRVWKLNPIIRFADAEINDYHEDFTDAATVIEGMQTAYQVGKGYLTEMLENKDDETLAETRDIEKVSSNPNTKKKTKLTSVQNQKKKKIKKLEQDSVKITENKFEESNNKNDISKKEMNELVSNKSEDTPIEVALEKPKPKMMVFKPINNEKKT
tara:strand:+ start:2657 stop:3421 length:765 start_codon:yes stop_codon:yes gene_type:complete